MNLSMKKVCTQCGETFETGTRDLRIGNRVIDGPDVCPKCQAKVVALPYEHTRMEEEMAALAEAIGTTFPDAEVLDASDAEVFALVDRLPNPGRWRVARTPAGAEEIRDAWLEYFNDEGYGRHL